MSRSTCFRNSKLQIQDKIYDLRFQRQISEFMKFNYDRSHIQELIVMVKCNIILKQHQGLIGLRQILINNEDDRQYLINTILKAKIYKYLIKFAKQSDFIQMKVDSAFILMLMLKGNFNQIQHLISNNILHILFKLLRSQNIILILISLQGLTQLAYRSQIARSLICNKISGFLIRLCHWFEDVKLITAGYQTLAYICDQLLIAKSPKGRPIIDQICYGIVSGRITNQNALQICYHVVAQYISNNRSVSFLEDGQVINALVQLLVQIKQKQLSQAKLPLRIFYEYTKYCQREYITKLLSQNFIKILQSYITHNQFHFRYLICNILFNICHGNGPVISLILQNQQLQQILIELLYNDVARVRQAVCNIIFQIISRGNRQKIDHSIHFRDVMVGFIYLLESQVSYLIEQGMNGLKYIWYCLQWDKCISPAYWLRRYKGVDKLIKLSHYVNKKIAIKAEQILIQYQILI